MTRYQAPKGITVGEAAMLYGAVDSSDAMLATVIAFVEKGVLAVDNVEPGSAIEELLARPDLLFRVQAREPDLKASHEERIWSAITQGGIRNAVLGRELRRDLDYHRREILDGLAFQVGLIPVDRRKALGHQLAGYRDFLVRTYADYSARMVSGTEQFDSELAFAVALGIPTPWARALRYLVQPVEE